ncbi:hypothetical protein [Corticicoccus populi]|uniref:Uncharacterized protein n=1 Tax=Corticicoccus populi TaxID=1812821 RepID=A0ABW5WTA9_9STAP
MSEKISYEELKRIALDSLEREQRILKEFKIIDQEMSALKNDNARLNRELNKYKGFLPIRAALKAKKMIRK